MHRMFLLRKRHVSPARVLPLCLLVVMHCALSGTVVDHGSFETKLTDMRLKDRRGLRFYYGGSVRVLSLSHINTVVIDPSKKMTVANELYYSAEITLKDGTRIKSLDRNRDKLTDAFISVQDVMTGRNEKDFFTIGLENVLRITVR